MLSQKKQGVKILFNNLLIFPDRYTTYVDIMFQTELNNFNYQSKTQRNFTIFPLFTGGD